MVIMTNGHEHDFQAEVQVLRGETAYVGVIGSRKKTAFVNQRLREAAFPRRRSPLSTRRWAHPSRP